MADATLPTAVPVDEIFLSLQGEGLVVGEPQLFLRLGGCPLRCRYCDTPRSWKVQPEAELHEPQGTRMLPNPLDGAVLREELIALAAAHELAPEELTLAVTGGEPLLHADFLAAWLPQWPGPVLLETAGIYAGRLASLLDQVDFLSLDWKLPGSLDAGGELLETEACLEAAAAAGTRGQVKIVVDEDTAVADLAHAVARCAALAPGLPVLLQPVTPVDGGPLPPSSAQLLDWAIAHRRHPSGLRVQAQMHPLLGLR